MNPKASRYYTYIRPVVQNKHVQTYSGLIFTLVTVSVFAIFAIRPTLSTIIGLQKSISEQQAVVTQLTAKMESISQAKRNYDQIDGSTKDKLDSLLPEKPQLKQIIDRLYTFTQANQATISGLQFQTLEINSPQNNPTSSLQEILFDFNLQGKFPQLMRVLTSFINSNRLISLNSIHITHSGDTLLIMTVNAKAFIIKH